MCAREYSRGQTIPLNHLTVTGRTVRGDKFTNEMVWVWGVVMSM